MRLAVILHSSTMALTQKVVLLVALLLISISLEPADAHRRGSVAGKKVTFRRITADSKVERAVRDTSKMQV